MSVLSYLNEVVSSVSIQDWEKDRIDASIRAIKGKIDNRLLNVTHRFVFGSYDRGVMLKRSVDANSDIDLFVGFQNGYNFRPQTLLSRLKRFAHENYKKEIRLDHPTVVIELEHIKFELVPGYWTYGGTCYIPAPSKEYLEWTQTWPSLDKDNLIEANARCYYWLKKLIKILKFWNVKKGKPFSSYELEKQLSGFNYILCNNLKECFYYAVSLLSTHNLPEYRKATVRRLQHKVATVKDLDVAHKDQNAAEVMLRQIFD